MTIAKVVTVGTPVVPQARISLGSLPASTDYDQVDVYYDPKDYLGTSCQFTFFLYGTTAGQKTLLKTLGPFGKSTVASRILTLRNEPGTTYSLEGALTSGSVLPGGAATIAAGLVGSNVLVNSVLDIDATPSPTSVPYVPGAQVTLIDTFAEHSRWNVRLNMAGNKFPRVMLRAYSVITAGANSIQALVGTVETSNPSSEGFQPFDLQIRTDHFLVTAEALDNRATGANALSIAHVGIGSDLALDGASPSAAALAQTVWWINPLTGNDDWDGTAQTHVANTRVGPLATFAEYIRRTGLNRPISVAVQINIDADLPASDPVILTGTFMNGAAKLALSGTSLTPVLTGTIDAYTAPVAATNTLPILNDAAVADWTPYAGMLLRVTSGAHSGAENGAMWIIKDLGGSNARVSNPAFWAGGNVTSFVPGAQDYEVVVPRLLNGGLLVDVKYGQQSTTNNLRVETVKLPTLAANSIVGYDAENVYFYNCHFASFITQFTKTNFFRNSQFSGFTIGFANSASTFQAGYLNGTILVLQNGVFQNEIVPTAIRAGTLTTNQLGNAVFEVKSGIQIADTTNYFNILDGNKLILRGEVYGVADAGTMYIIGAGAKALTTAATNMRIGGAVNDITIAGKTQIFPYDAATGLPQAAVQTCSLANFAAAGLFNGNIHDPFTGTQFLTAA